MECEYRKIYMFLDRESVEVFHTMEVACFSIAPETDD